MQKTKIILPGVCQLDHHSLLRPLEAHVLQPTLFYKGIQNYFQDMVKKITEKYSINKTVELEPNLNQGKSEWFDKSWIYEDPLLYH